MNENLIDWEKITITNNLMFCSVMQDEEICKEFLETMLQIKIDRLSYVKAEDSISNDFLGRGIRLDVHVKDSDREFDLEMQMTDTKDLPLRARFYHSLLDADALDKGQRYDMLKESFVIFICPFDVFGKELPVYSFDRICLEEASVTLGDRSHTIFFNFKAWEKANDHEIKNVLKYFQNGTVDSVLTGKINSLVTQNRYKREWRENFMTYEQDMIVREQVWYNNGLEAGIEKGAAAQKAEDEKIIQEKEQELQQRDAALQQKMSELQQNTTVLQEKLVELQQKTSELQQRDEVIHKRTTELQEKETELQQKSRELQQKDDEIAKMAEEMNRLKAMIESK
ncbi:MAG: Rpn family recombination-promoting nuclease/putative transposase [Treponema sp.]|nr:Rpn family recombination-promoting nuclease/putative transposase [Candidatus Treponema scatequi]